MAGRREKVKKRDVGSYRTQYLRGPFRLATSIFRIHGEKYAMHFKEEWVPLMYEIINEGSMFN